MKTGMEKEIEIHKAMEMKKEVDIGSEMAKEVEICAQRGLSAPTCSCEWIAGGGACLSMGGDESNWSGCKCVFLKLVTFLQLPLA